jgi:peroxin-14
MIIVLQDPSVAGSPLENRIAFLQSKNLTQEEVDIALARAGGESAPANYSNYAPQQQVIRQPQPGYGGYQQYPWQQPPPPELPKRDWRDWFIMATVMGGVGYGLYFVAKVAIQGRFRIYRSNVVTAICLSYGRATYASTARTG